MRLSVATQRRKEAASRFQNKTLVCPQNIRKASGKQHRETVKNSGLFLCVCVCNPRMKRSTNHRLKSEKLYIVASECFVPLKPEAEKMS